MMGRSTSLPWLLAALGVFVGGGVWVLRKVSAFPRAQAIVRKAWTAGRRVALEGRQKIQMPDAGGKIVEVEAKVLTSRDEQKRIEFLSKPLAGVIIWESGDRTYRYNPNLKRLTVAHRRGSPGDEARQELQLLRNYEVREA